MAVEGVWVDLKPGCVPVISTVVRLEVVDASSVELVRVRVCPPVEEEEGITELGLT